MKLARARVGDAVIAASVEGDLLVELEVRGAEGCPEDPLMGWLRTGADLGALVPARTGRSHQLADAQLLAPIQRPGKIIAVGLNYADHTLEAGLEAPAEPLTFAKYPSSITGPDTEIIVPAAVTTEVDWEAELAIVIGTVCGPQRRGTMANVAAFTVANDVSARDLQFRDGQWTRAKSLDTFCPIGPVLVTPDDIPDPASLRIYATVNGQVMQDAKIGDMIFPISTLLDFITATITLEPGDMILTGTPPGVGGFRNPPVFLADGDVIEVGVDTVGVLRNTVRHI
ncbi:hypothetical protein AL755_03800 (plasmid) [Arthrobacter sp. ERGS1:01]|uniref:fumarylacetoacetate hydrolase family protein n=1 Tax=Arthrobacter sp. ERGS1:01 TaxID=1704044 RepID=UPI0006B476CB|nr:fumarylacetoacetate hydrolase family protein [Arthrobacter sp. ERGS1:01]ALE04813.1 hypothetical protein AL755_03800 [Arthrobacter sp. ERGS1:01]